MYIDPNQDTIFAPATVPGTGAITLVRISGPQAIASAARLVRCAGEGTSDGKEPCGDNPALVSADLKSDEINRKILESKGYRIHFGRILSKDGSLLDEVLVSVFRAPHSYTGEDSIEISCHASSYIMGEISTLLIDLGLRPADPGEFTRRAFLNGKMDLAQAEAVADVIASKSEASHRLAFGQMKGEFSAYLKKMREELLTIASLMELELDFSDEDVEFADRDRLSSLVEGLIAHTSSLKDSFRLGNAIKEGIPVAIVGATNVGKSTLLNALVGEDRAIVSDIHGTTRDTVEESVNIGGMLFRFIDTAGLRETEEEVEKIGIERSYKKLSEAEIILGITDATRPLPQIEAEIPAILTKADQSRQEVCIVLNKCDALPDVEDNCAGDGDGRKSDEGKVAAGDGDGRKDNTSNNNVMDLNKIVLSLESKGIKTFRISARQKTGLEALQAEMEASRKDLLRSSGGTIVTNIRHCRALQSTLTALTRVRDGITRSLPGDLLAQDLREALYHLGSITGEISTDEILGNIFRNFCIGK